MEHSSWYTPKPQVIHGFHDLGKEGAIANGLVDDRDPRADGLLLLVLASRRVIVETLVHRYTKALSYVRVQPGCSPA